MPAFGALAGVSLMLGHFYGLLGEIENLVSRRRRVVGARLRQGSIAALTSFRAVMDEVIDFLRRQRISLLALVPELSAALSPALGLWRFRWRTGRIRGRRLVRVPRVLPQSLLELLDSRHSLGELLVASGAASTPRSWRWQLHFLHTEVIGREEAATLLEWPKKRSDFRNYRDGRLSR
jgi:hypothetical protein